MRVWDVSSGECLELIEWSCDVAPIAAGGLSFPWRAIPRGEDGETVIEPATGGDAIAWFPVALRCVAADPSGRIWAGSVDNHLYLIRLEGGPDSMPPAGDSR